MIGGPDMSAHTTTPPTDDLVDVAVIGAGTMGSMTLWQLAEQPGLSVLGIEQYGPAHSYGAFTGESRLYRAANKEGLIYTEAALTARRLWAELEAASGRRILERIGVLGVGPTGHDALEMTIRTATDNHLPIRVLDATDLRREYPQFHVEDDDMGVLDLLGGGLRPEVAVASALHEAQKHGARVLFDTTVRAIEPGSSPDAPVAIVLDEGGGARSSDTSSGGELRTVYARKVVVTAGSWTAQVLPELNDLVKPILFSLFWFMPRNVDAFAPDRLPGWMRDLGEHHAFGVPSLDGYSFKLAPSIAGNEPAETWDALDFDLTREQVREVGRIGALMFPDVDPEPVRWSRHPDSTTADHVPVIDAIHDGRVVVAGGMSGNGFKFAPAYGRIAADLALTGTSTLQQSMFTVESHRARAAARAAGGTVDGADLILQGH